MDKVLGFRRPPIKTQKSKLSFISKVFFLLDIVQVIVVGSIQITMMVIGDYRPIKDGGMGLGRRLYMILFTCCVIYTCLLCLFAIRLQNFLEIAAFVFQNYLFMCYSFIQVYHLHFKKNYSIPVKFKSHPVIRILVLLNSVYLIIMNIVFTFLAVKLFQEYGWKIYKKVRFNVNLRGAYHMYELVLCLMKMNLLVLAMLSICYNQTVLRDMQSSKLFYITIATIPIGIILGFIGYFGIRRENKILTVIFILSQILAMGCFMYSIYKVGKLECFGCPAYFRTFVDLPREVVIHIMYLATLALIFCLALCIATLKAFRNFGKGLKEHFVSRNSSRITLSLGITRNISDMFRNLPGDVDTNTNNKASSSINMVQFNQHNSLVPSDIQHDETGLASNSFYIEDDGSSGPKENMSNHIMPEGLTLSNKHVVNKSPDEIRENELFNELNQNNVANEHFTSHEMNKMYEYGDSSRRPPSNNSECGDLGADPNQQVLGEQPRRRSTAPVKRWFNVTAVYNKTVKQLDSFYRTTHRRCRMSYRFRRSKVTKYGDCHIPSFCAESILSNNGIVINTGRGRKVGMPLVVNTVDTETDVFTNVITTNDMYLSSTDSHKRENESLKRRIVSQKYSRSELFTVDNIIQEENEDDNDDTFLPT